MAVAATNFTITITITQVLPASTILVFHHHHHYDKLHHHHHYNPSTSSIDNFGVSLLMLAKDSIIATSSIAIVISSLYFFRRSKWCQTQVMKYKLSKWQKWTSAPWTAKNPKFHTKFHRLTIHTKLDREKELGVIKHLLYRGKPSIMFISGPEGCGKSALTFKALEEAQNVLYLDLYKQQVGSGSRGAHELMEQLARKSGYFFPLHFQPTALGIISGDTGKANSVEKTSYFELEKCLYLLECALKEVASESRQYPMIVIDELNSLSHSTLKSPDFLRLLHWMMHISDIGLCQVVFVGQDATLGILDKSYESLRQRRIHFPIDYPTLSPETVTIALRVGEQGTIEDDPLSLLDKEADAKLMISTFGGNLRDMDKAVEFSNNGLSVKSTVSRMLTASSRFIINTCIEPLLVQISSSSSTDENRTLNDVHEKEQACLRFLRCWNMLKFFSEGNTKVSYDRLLLEVFEDAGHEIDEYVENGILRYCWPPLGSDEAHEMSLSPQSPRYQCAFKYVVNKPALIKITMSVKQELARIQLLKEQNKLSKRVDTMINIHDTLAPSTVASDLEKDIAKVWGKLRSNWRDFDELSGADGKETQNEEDDSTVPSTEK
eukprot:CAMPEP_0204843980 /NCGR_PEP_ID=MMETSP1346-20131115/48293_1 /ASSEMBLY_ACC=CAM_ASM_000771 /TAXON_ID=215587 /ORGANISM="Aplanochytrium stocchinoi, Strain GSBS06" /LENGTH=604 /DNA_ID=CAMNT_0051983207 /DNA_START=418 /DNA_END=2232 /DNA_ORIENTATION=+